MKLFIRKSLTYILSILLIIFSVNFVSDPASLFSGFAMEIAKYISNGFNVTGIQNIDERILQKNIIENIIFTPEIIILGSSRIMQVGQSYYGTKSFNNGVSGASIEDIIAIYQIYKENDTVVKKIVIGIDPWLFNENNGQSRWLSIKQDYDSFYGKNTNNFIKNIPILKYAQLFSPSYFQASIKSLLKTINNKVIPTGDKYNRTLTRLTDGTITYGLEYRTRSETEINNAAIEYINGNIYSIENFKEISETIRNDFEIFIKKILKEGVEIEFLLMPYHPIVWKHIDENRKYEKVKEVESFIYDCASKNNIKIIGSYDPEPFRLTSSDFYDGMHLSPDGIEKVIQK